jgi:xanthine dehydrogenase accessory factor
MEVADVASTVQDWLAEGAQVAMAWPVAFAGFSSRRPGEVLAVSDSGRQVGEVLGDRVTAELAAVLTERLSGVPAEGAGAGAPVGSGGGPAGSGYRGADGAGGPQVALLRLPVDEPAAAAAGLACGGTVTVALHHSSAIPARFWEAIAGGQPVAMVTHVVPEPAARVPGTLLVGPDGVVAGSLGAADVDQQAATEARALLAGGRTASRVVPSAGGSLVIEAVVPAAKLVVVGGGDLADAIGRQASLLNWQPQVVDGPDPAVPAQAIGRLGPADGVVVLSHDHDVGVPALAAALATRAGYIGALGSRRTQAARRDALLAGGTNEPDLARVHGPAGLDLGGRAPEEIALAICAQMLAVRSGRDAGALSERSGSIHG